jgi:hypothetical protein
MCNYGEYRCTECRSAEKVLTFRKERKCLCGHALTLDSFEKNEYLNCSRTFLRRSLKYHSKVKINQTFLSFSNIKNTIFYNLSLFYFLGKLLIIKHFLK